MKTLLVLFIISASLIFVGCIALKATFEEIVDAIYMKIKTKGSELVGIVVLLSIVSLIFGIIGAVLYYQVCAATIEDIVKPRHPVEEPIPYGIGMIITSLLFAGGFAGSACVREKSIKFIKPIIITAIILLPIYLILKAQMILH